MREKVISQSCDRNPLVMSMLYLIICYLLSLFMELFIMLAFDVVIAIAFVYASHYIFTKRILKQNQNHTLTLCTENLRKKYYNEETFNVHDIKEVFKIKVSEYLNLEKLELKYFQNISRNKYLVCIKLVNEETLIIKYTNKKNSHKLIKKINTEIKHEM